MFELLVPLLHWSLDIERCETPLEAFGKRRATDAIRKRPRMGGEGHQ